MPYLSTTKEKHTLLALYIQPKSFKNKFCGIHGQEMKIMITAPPVDGKANKGVVQFVAKFLGVPKSAVSLKRGKQSRHKQLVVAGMSCDEVRERIDKSVDK